jgi:hypothetical protein
MKWTRTTTFVTFRHYHLSQLAQLTASHFGLVCVCVCVFFFFFTRMCKTIPVYRYSSKMENKKISWRETENVCYIGFLNNLSLQQITPHTDLSSLQFTPFFRSNLVAVRRTFLNLQQGSIPTTVRLFPNRSTHIAKRKWHYNDKHTNVSGNRPHTFLGLSK